MTQPADNIKTDGGTSAHPEAPPSALDALGIPPEAQQAIKQAVRELFQDQLQPLRAEIKTAIAQAAGEILKQLMAQAEKQGGMVQAQGGGGNDLRSMLLSRLMSNGMGGGGESNMLNTIAKLAETFKSLSDAVTAPMMTSYRAGVDDTVRSMGAWGKLSENEQGRISKSALEGRRDAELDRLATKRVSKAEAA